MLLMQHEFVQSLEGGKTPQKEISKELGWPSIRSGRLVAAQPLAQPGQAVVWVHTLFAEGTGESTVRMEFDDPGLQLETGVKLGELRETDGGSRSESPAKCLKPRQRPFFHSLAPVTPVNAPTTARPEFSIREEKP
jgi:hypothetical protein